MRRLCVAVALGLFTVVFVQNAWVCDDAYITFRSVEQLFAGNGLRWNPNERVQAFTHPLWLGAMAAGRLVSRDVFINAIVASFVFSVLGLLALARLLGFSPRWLVCVLLLTASRAFVDYSSSGLENPLSFLLIAVFLVSFLDARQRESGKASARSVAWFAFLFALALCNRHDLGTLLLPPLAFVAWRHRALGARRLAGALALGLVPFLFWTAFSLFYYGFPFPNTAYAKLDTGVPESALLAQGVHYFWTDLCWDPLTLGTVLLAIPLAAAQRSSAFRALALGLLLNVAYVVAVGGDFMHGRFWAAAFAVAAPLLVALAGRVRWRLAALAAVCVAVAAIEPHSPIRTSAGYSHTALARYGIADERGYYFATSSLWAWLRWDPLRDGEVFPHRLWALEGAAVRDDPALGCARSRSIGYFGYWAGTRKIIVDVLGLGDPLLARLPCKRPWRIGHFERHVPEGYIDSLLTGENRIANPALARYYDKLRLITQGDLWSLERLKTILLMNLGAYNHLLESYVRAQ